MPALSLAKDAFLFRRWPWVFVKPTPGGTQLSGNKCRADGSEKGPEEKIPSGKLRRLNS